MAPIRAEWLAPREKFFSDEHVAGPFRVENPGLGHDPQKALFLPKLRAPQFEAPQKAGEQPCNVVVALLPGDGQGLLEVALGAVERRVAGRRPALDVTARGDPEVDVGAAEMGVEELSGVFISLATAKARSLASAA